MEKRFQLKGSYQKAYKQISLAIRQEAQRSQQREQTLREMENMLFQAQLDGTPLSAVFSDGYETFYRDILETLPRYTVEEKYYRHRLHKRRKIAIGCAASFAAGLFLLWNFGFLAYWFRGVPGLLEEENNFMSSSLYTTGRTFSISIDLHDFDSNKGKVLIDDEYGKILVDSIYITEANSRQNVYCVQFESISRHTMSHIQFYSPLPSRTADSPAVYGMVKYGDSQVPMYDRSSGPATRNGALFGMYTIRLDKDALPEPPVITLVFDNFEIKRYSRTGWGKWLHIG